MINQIKSMIFGAVGQAVKTAVAEASKQTPTEIEIPTVLRSSYGPFAKKAALFLIDANEYFKSKYGPEVGIHMAFRTWKTQEELYKIGRRGIVGEKIVTKAKPGSSFHNYGVAIDVVFDGNTSKSGMQWSWNDNFPWKELGEIGEKHGFEWAGRWTNFPEMPHFQMTYGFTIKELLSFYNEGGLERVWAEFDKKQV